MAMFYYTTGWNKCYISWSKLWHLPRTPSQFPVTLLKFCNYCAVILFIWYEKTSVNINARTETVRSTNVKISSAHNVLEGRKSRRVIKIGWILWGRREAFLKGRVITRWDYILKLEAMHQSWWNTNRKHPRDFQSRRPCLLH